MTCPKCEKENDDNWPLDIYGKILFGGCQDCWEKECDDTWWEAVIFVNELALMKNIESI